VGKDRATIANALRLLKLPAEVRGLVQDGTIGMGPARALLGLDDAATIGHAARRIAAGGLSVRATEELVRRERGLAAKPANSEQKPKSAGVRDLEQRLLRRLGARVVIHDKGGNRGGRIEIRYANLDDLDRILEKLTGG
jgi:ParB family chromosome partitioning protein